MAFKRMGVTKDQLKESKTAFQRMADMMEKLRKMATMKFRSNHNKKSDTN